MRYPPRPSPPSAEPLRPQIWSSCALRRPRPAQSACQLESVSVSFIAARPFSSSRVASNHHLRIAQTTRIESSRRACRFRASQCRCRRRRRVVEMSRSLSSNGVGGRAPSSSRPMPATAAPLFRFAVPETRPHTRAQQTSLATQLRLCRVSLAAGCRGRLLRHVRHSLLALSGQVNHSNLRFFINHRHGRYFEGSRLSIQVGVPSVLTAPTTQC